MSEARKKLDELQTRYAKQRGAAPLAAFGMFLDSWIAGRAHELEPKSIRNYAFGIALAKPRLGHVRIDALTRDQIAGALDGLRKDGKGPRTIQVVYDTLRAALNWALKHGNGIVANPIVGVSRPKTTREIDFLTRDEARAFLEAVAKSRYRALFHVAIALGLRWGEIAGLQWRDVDLRNATITISRSLKETGEIGSTKSASSRRRIDLPASIVDELERHRKRASDVAGSALVFRSTTGSSLLASNFARNVYFPALATAGLRRIRFHDLRHTCAAIRLLAGEHPSVIQHLLGHSSVRTTLDVYGHLQPTIGKAAAARYDEAMGA